MRACVGLPRHLSVTADGEAVALPPGVRGLVVLNVASFMGGVRPWPTSEPPGAADDGRLEVAAHLNPLTNLP